MASLWTRILFQSGTGDLPIGPLGLGSWSSPTASPGRVMLSSGPAGSSIAPVAGLRSPDESAAAADQHTTKNPAEAGFLCGCGSWIRPLPYNRPGRLAPKTSDNHRSRSSRARWRASGPDFSRSWVCLETALHSLHWRISAGLRHYFSITSALPGNVS